MKPVIAAALLLAWWLGHHAYRLAPVDIEGHAWNVGGALSRMVLLALVVAAWRSPLIDMPAAWFAAEEVQAVGCTVAYVIKPWPMEPGQEKCSEALGLPLQMVCLVALLWCGAWLADAMREKRS